MQYLYRIVQVARFELGIERKRLFEAVFPMAEPDRLHIIHFLQGVEVAVGGAWIHPPIHECPIVHVLVFDLDYWDTRVRVDRQPLPLRYRSHLSG